MTPGSHLASKMTAILVEYDRPGKAGLAARVIIRVLATHHAQTVRGGVYLESCPAHVLAWAGGACGRTTVLDAWGRLNAALTWVELDEEEAVAVGARIRPLGPGQSHGRHILVDPEIRAFCALLVDVETLPPLADLATYYDVRDPERLARVVPGPRRHGGRPVKMRCPNPLHEDVHPSASAWLNADGVTGGGICFACSGAGGGPLTFRHRELAPGTWGATFRAEDAEALGLTQATPGHARQSAPLPLPEPPSALTENVGSPYSGTKEDWRGAIGRPPGIFGVPGTRTRSHRPEDTARTITMKMGRRGAPYGYALARGGTLAMLRNAEVYARSERHYAQALRDLATGEDSPRSGRGLHGRFFSASTSRAIWRDWAHDGKILRRPTGAEAVAQSWVGFDLDGTGELTEEDLDAVRAVVEHLAASMPELSGATAAVHTSPGGLQVHLELAREIHGDLAAWWASDVVREWYARIAAQLVLALGGKVRADMSSAAAGRLMRRPGWRITKAGALYLAHLVWSGGRRGDLAA